MVETKWQEKMQGQFLITFLAIHAIVPKLAAILIRCLSFICNASADLSILESALLLSVFISKTNKCVTILLLI